MRIKDCIRNLLLGVLDKLIFALQSPLLPPSPFKILQKLFELGIGFWCDSVELVQHLE